MYFDKKGSLLANLVDVNGNPLQQGSTGNLTSAPLAVQDFLLAGSAWSPRKNWFSISTPTDAGQQIQPFGMMVADDDSSIPLAPWYNNFEKTLLASAARIGDVNTADQVNRNAKGVGLFLNVSAVGAPAGSVTPKLQLKDPVSGGYFTAWAAAVAVASTGLRLYLFYPSPNADAAVLATEAVELPLLRTWRVFCDHANEADSITYSLGLCYLVN